MPYIVFIKCHILYLNVIYYISITISYNGYQDFGQVFYTPRNFLSSQPAPTKIMDDFRYIPHYR